MRIKKPIPMKEEMREYSAHDRTVTERQTHHDDDFSARTPEKSLRTMKASSSRVISCEEACQMNIVVRLCAEMRPM